MDAALAARLSALRAIGSATPLEPVEGKRPRTPVARSHELDRILALPLRDPPTPDLRDLLRAAVTKPGASMKPWDLQCDALLAAFELVDAHDPKTGRAPGLLAAVAVGGGKTLIAALLGTLWGSTRPVILTTAALAGQTRREVERYREHFHVPADVQVLPYSILSQADQEEALEELLPDAIIADEAHALRNHQSGRGRRLRRYLKAHPRTRLAMLTGTIARKSLLEWAELAALALVSWSPAPLEKPIRREWAEALDPDAVRPVGALRLLVNVPEALTGDQADDAAVVREAMARRIARSPGCIASGEASVDVPLVVQVLPSPVCGKIEKAREKLAATWTRPDGEELALAAEFAEVDRQLRLGGFYAWREPWRSDPDFHEWRRVRAEWRRAARAFIIEHRGRPIDTMLALENAIARGEASIPEYGPWCAAREQYTEPPKVWEWISDAVARWAADLIFKPQSGAGSHSPSPDRTPAGPAGGETGPARALAGGMDPPSAVFGQRTAFARHVAELAGAPWYGSGDDPAGEDGTRSIVLSIGAHGQGRNLQHFSRALMLDPPPSGATWEQLLGRLHRPGQASEVIYLAPGSFAVEIDRALREARWLASTTGLPQKLVQADLRWTEET